MSGHQYCWAYKLKNRLFLLLVIVSPAIARWVSSLAKVEILCCLEKPSADRLVTEDYFVKQVT